MNKNFFEIGVRYYKNVKAEGLKLVNELYVINAASFADAETLITKVINTYSGDKLWVLSIKRSNIDEVIKDELGVASYVDAEAQKILGQNKHATGLADKLYKAKLNLIIVDENNGKEKKSPYYILVNAGSVNAAHDLIVEKKAGWGQYFEIASIDETKLVDVINIIKDEC